MISKATLGRIPNYLKTLQELPENVSDISATTLAKRLSLGEVQVRKDLASVCGRGRPKTGYNVDELIQSMKSVTNGGARKEAVIVGAGKLGRALLDYSGFSEYGLVVLKAFDNDNNKLGGNVLPVGDMYSYCALHQIEIGILTVPPEAAQEAANEMVRCGIRAILSFSSSHLQVPEGVIVKNENLALSLAHLQLKLNEI